MSIASRQRSAERANGRIMAEQTIIESVRAFLQGCPLLTGDRINVDFLAPEEGGYSINASPAKPIIQQYVNGSSKRQFVFVLASSEYYGEDIRQQLDNIGFYQQFAECFGFIEAVKQSRSAESGRARHQAGYTILNRTTRTFTRRSSVSTGST